MLISASWDEENSEEPSHLVGLFCACWFVKMLEWQKISLRDSQ